MATAEDIDAHLRANPFSVRIDESERQFTSYSQLFEFFDNERKFWQGCDELPYFGIAANVLSRLQRLQQPDVRLPESFNDIRQIPNIRTIVSSSSKKGEFLKNVHQRNGGAAKIASQFLLGAADYRDLGNVWAWDGRIAASIFTNPWMTSAPNDAEIKAFEKCRKDAEEFLSNAQDEEIKIRASIEQWRAQTQTEISEFLQTGRATLEKQHSDWDTTLKDFKVKWEAERQETKRVYDEQIKLSEPAKYWESLTKDYEDKGRSWVLITAAVATLLLTFVCWFVYRPPDLLRSERFTLSGFKGALLIGAGISMAIYLINLCGKFATSSFHLARDARERYQLTHVYLALVREGAVTDEARDVILSALFSRADTGLLKSDATPAFPGALEALLKSSKG